MLLTTNALTAIASDMALIGITTIHILDISNVVLVTDTTLTWTPSGVTISESTHPAMSVTSTGVADHFDLVVGASVFFTGTCGTIGADLNFSSLSLVSGDTVTLASLDISFDNC